MKKYLYASITGEDYWKYFLKRIPRKIKRGKNFRIFRGKKKELADKLELIKAITKFRGLI